MPFGGGYSLLKKEFSKAFREIAQEGYGLIFISHASDQTLKDKAGKEYTRKVPAAPSAPRAIVNKLVDFIIYIGIDYDEKHPDGVRFMQMKGTKDVQAGSRFNMVPERIPFGYEELLKAVTAAIEEQVGGRENLPEENENFYKDNSRPFSEAMEEAQAIWFKLLENDDSDELADEMSKIVEKNFNARIKLSTVVASQQGMLELTILDLKDLLESKKV